MHLLKTIKLISGFYRNFLVLSILIATFCVSIFLKYGFSSFMALLWFKIATLGFTYYFINSYKGKEYYYYFNLGVSKILLWTVTLAFDFTLFLFLLILIDQIR